MSPIKDTEIHPLRDGAVFASSVFAAILACVAFFHWRTNRLEFLESRENLTRLVSIAASLVDGDAHARLHDAAKLASPEYASALAPLVKLHRGLPDIAYLYTVTKNEGGVCFILDTATAGAQALRTTRELISSAPMEKYQHPSRELLATLQDGQARASQALYQDEFGTFISAYAPIRDEQGRLDGVIGIDHSAEDIKQRQSDNLHNTLATLAGGATISILLGFLHWRSRRHSLTRELERLRIAEALAKSEEQYKQAAEEAETAARAKSEFLAMMSHEIRTPLNGVLGFNEMLTQTPLNARQREMVEVSQGCGRALLTLIDDILIFSKAEAGQLQIENSIFEIEACAEEVFQVCAASLSPHGDVELFVDLQLPSSTVTGDITRFRQVLFNLVGNAVKFTHTGSVSLHVFPVLERPGVLRFEVRDTGAGIPADRLEVLFTPFVQADSSTTRRYGGTGLGLAICRRLVLAMGGSIGVHSIVGVGSTFYFELPLTLVPGASSPHSPHPGSPRKLLLVETPGPLRDARHRALQRCDYVADCAGDFRHAETLLLSATYDALVISHSGEAEDTSALKAFLGLSKVFSLACVVHLPFQRKDAMNAAAFGRPMPVLGRPYTREQLHHALLRQWSAEPSPALEAVSASHPAAAELARCLHILLVEDIPTNQLLIKTMLSRLGCTFHVAESGVEAVERATTTPYDLVLMDLQMPGMGGLEATQLIRQHELAESTAHPQFIVALTASALDDERQRCIQSGMDGYLVKPIGFGELKRLIQERAQALEAGALSAPPQEYSSLR